MRLLGLAQECNTMTANQLDLEFSAPTRQAPSSHPTGGRGGEQQFLCSIRQTCTMFRPVLASYCSTEKTHPFIVQTDAPPTLDWNKLHSFDHVFTLCQIRQHALDGKLRFSKFRSICWKVCGLAKSFSTSEKNFYQNLHFSIRNGVNSVVFLVAQERVDIVNNFMTAQSDN